MSDVARKEYPVKLPNGERLIFVMEYRKTGEGEFETEGWWVWERINKIKYTIAREYAPDIAAPYPEAALKVRQIATTANIILGIAPGE